MQYRFRRGFTLVELMIVVVIVALLLLISLPAYQRYTRASNRAVAAAGLLSAMARQEQFFVEHKRYAENLQELGYDEDPYAINRQGAVVTRATTAKVYIIELSTQIGAYALHARPQHTQLADTVCGTLNLSSIGMKSVSGSGTTAQCW